jgi:hypothetical protein
METEVIHCKNAAAVNAAGNRYVYVGRPTKWGNPFSHKSNTKAQYLTTSREEAVRRYEDYLIMNKELIASLTELKGKVLGCWCSPKLCHAQVLAKHADMIEEHLEDE